MFHSQLNSLSKTGYKIYVSRLIKNSSDYINPDNKKYILYYP